MILKMRVHQHAGVGADEGWVWLDGVQEAHSYGQLLVDGPDGAEIGTFDNVRDLSAAVERMWGPIEHRTFDREYWPEFAENAMAMSAHVVRLEHSDGRRTLCVLMHDAFLLGPDGKTVDRLR